MLDRAHRMNVSLFTDQTAPWESFDAPTYLPGLNDAPFFWTNNYLAESLSTVLEYKKNRVIHAEENFLRSQRWNSFSWSYF